MRFAARWLFAVAVCLALGARAYALPIDFSDKDGTRYSINTEVDPLTSVSYASGAITDATYVKPVTVTSYFIGFTPWFGFTTVYTVVYQVNIPLTDAFAGFNGFLITAIDGEGLDDPLVYNPNQPLTGSDCKQGNNDRQLHFPTQTYAEHDLQVARSVFVPNNDNFVRWLNRITNTGSTPVQVTATLRGLLGSGSDTRITATSNGDSSLGTGDQWFTSAEAVPKGSRSTQPRIGFVVQGDTPISPATSVGINSNGATAFSFSPTIQPGETAIVMTFVTVQGSSKQAKSKVENLVTLPSKAIACLTETELTQIVNFGPLAAPETKKATVTLKFDKDGKDTIHWKGDITVGAGVSLEGLPVSVDVGGVTQQFTLNKKGKANAGDGNTFHLKAKLKKGVTKAAPVKFVFELKGDFQETLATYGLVDQTVQDVAVSIPVELTAGPLTFAADQAFSYGAKQGKKGTAKGS